MFELDYTKVVTGGGHHYHHNHHQHQHQRLNGGNNNNNNNHHRSNGNKPTSRTANIATSSATTVSQTTSDNGKVNKQINYSRYKTEMCRQYSENGECKYGEKCQFAHGPAELKDVSRHPKYKTDLCKTFHSKGFCPYGPRCHFIHDITEYQQELAAAAANALRFNNNSAINKYSDHFDHFGQQHTANGLLKKIKSLRLDETSKLPIGSSSLMNGSNHSLLLASANANNLTNSRVAPGPETNISSSLSSSQSPSPNSFTHLTGINHHSSSASSSSRSSSSSISTSGGLVGNGEGGVDTMFLMANVFSSPVMGSAGNGNDVFLGFYPSGGNSSGSSSEDELHMLSNFSGLMNAAAHPTPSIK